MENKKLVNDLIDVSKDMLEVLKDSTEIDYTEPYVNCIGNVIFDMWAITKLLDLDTTEIYELVSGLIYETKL